MECNNTWYFYKVTLFLWLKTVVGRLLVASSFNNPVAAHVGEPFPTARIIKAFVMFDL
jgi:hypothetical protein